MLTAAHRAIVKATVPLLESGGEALTKHFYAALLQDNPELRPYFNQANQQSGHQQRALANGVLMYARNIDRLEALGDLVGTVVAKHVSLQIQPEHYPVVGGCLLRSIRAVLGAEVATDAVIEAWGAAYGQLADILMGAEKARYDDIAARPGGWRGGRLFNVISKHAESDEITSFRLEPRDGRSVVRHEPGQYIGLRLQVQGHDVRRNYSLSAAADGRGYRISVKREPGGLVSNHLHDHVGIGDSLELFAPAGQFVLRDSQRPVVLITGGVGITAAMAMLHAEVAGTSSRSVTFIHAARHAGVHAFRTASDAIASANPRVRCFYSHDTASADMSAAGIAAPDFIGRVGLDQLAAWMPQDRDVDAYFLGPTAFMRSVKRHLVDLGVPQSQTFFEFFGPAQALDTPLSI